MEAQEKYNLPFPANLRKLLGDKATTITALARELGISRQAVSQYADGTGQPNVDKLAAIAEYFDVSSDYLIGRTDVPSADVNEIAVCEYTGLSVLSVSSLHNITSFVSSLGLGDYWLPTIINNLIDDERHNNIEKGERNYRSVLSLIQFFLNYENKTDGNTLIYQNGDTQRIKGVTGFAENAIMLDEQMVENAALLETQRALINLKRQVRNNTGKNGGAKNG